MLKAITKLPQAPTDKLNGVTFDCERIVTLGMIRSHTKTDDIITVTDDQLRLYRRAALEAAEKYTGLLLTGQQVITEDVPLPKWEHAVRSPFFNYKTQYAFAQPMAYLYGMKNQAVQVIGVTVGTNTARLPVIYIDFGMGCCNPCREDDQPKFMYVAGYRCEEAIPAAITLGALKYIAHVIENPGDLVRQFNARQVSVGETSVEANNPALASGAIDIWRTVKDDAI